MAPVQNAALVDNAPRPRLYQEIARRLERLIEKGTFRPGSRIPSVRALSRQRSVSITTVLEAYRVLEDQGFIEARPQSGYFVRPRLLRTVEEPAVSTPPETPRTVGNSNLRTVMMRDSSDPSFVHLGPALPSPDLLPLDKLGRALSRAARRHRRRLGDPADGVPELRSQIARRAIASGCELTPDDLVITNGCREAIFYALRATCRPGDTVAVESPTFYGILLMAETLDLRVCEIASFPRDGMCLVSLERALRKHPIRAVIAITNYSNPLGSCMPNEKKKELVRILAKRDIPLIEDDIAGDLSHLPGRPKTAKSFDRKGLVMLCSSFSKTLAPAYRVGWIAAGRFHDHVLHQKMISNFATGTLPQLAIADFLANGGYDRHLRRMTRVYANNMAMMTQVAAESFPRGTRISQPTGYFVIWIELPKGIDSLKLYERAREHRISFAPGPLFSAKGAYRNFIRLAATAWSERIRQAVVTLGRLASA